MCVPNSRLFALLLFILLLPACSGDGPSQAPENPPEDESAYIALDVYRSSLDIRCAIYAENISPADPDELMAFGAGGRALHYRGNHWARPIFLGTTADVLTVSSVSMNHFFAGGSQQGGSALLLEYNGDGWEPLTNSVTGNITGMNGNDFVTDQGGIYVALAGRHAELRFQAPEGVRFRNLNSTTNSGAGILIAVGDEGAIFHRDSYEADWVDRSVAGGPDFNAVVLAPGTDPSPYDAYAVGDDEIWRYRYQTWEKVYDFASGTLNDIIFRQLDQSVYAVGGNGLVLHLVDDEWWDEILDPEVDLRCIAMSFIGSGDQNIMSIGGEGGHVYSFADPSWEDRGLSAVDDWKAVELSPSLVNYAATGNVIHRFLGGDLVDYCTWDMGETIDAFTILASGDIWALGSMADGLDHFVLRYDGSEWTIMKQISWDRFTGIWSDPAGEHIFVIDSTGTIWHRQDDSWGLEPELVIPGGAALNGIAGSSPEDLIAVGDGGVIFRRGPSGWAKEDSGVDGNLLAIDGAVAVGEGGLVLVDDGAVWQTVATGIEANLRDVRVLAADDVWVAGDETTLLHFDGTAWQRQITHLPGLDFLSLAPEPSGRVWIGASEGYLMLTP